MEGDFYRWSGLFGQARLEKDNGEVEKDDEEDENEEESVELPMNCQCPQ